MACSLQPVVRDARPSWLPSPLLLVGKLSKLTEILVRIFLRKTAHYFFAHVTACVWTACLLFSSAQQRQTFSVLLGGARRRRSVAHALGEERVTAEGRNQKAADSRAAVTLPARQQNATDWRICLRSTGSGDLS